MIKGFTPELSLFHWVTLVAFLVLGIVVAIRLRQRGPLVSWTACGLVFVAGGSQSLEVCFGFAFYQLQWSDGFYRQSDGWQLGWLIARLVVIGLFSLGLLRGLSRLDSARQEPAVNRD